MLPGFLGIIGSREWPEGVAAEVHWRTAQTSGPDARASQRLEIRGHWKVDPLAFRFTLIPFADEGGTRCGERVFRPPIRRLEVQAKRYNLDA
jgi:hypothetical protein